ncbi:MAG: DUF4194 domain-containing protein [Wenzhouxiangella sp.]|nr:DUF4194 domain-containing protein [Wenzhouxiangella sp.]MCH8477407.1 DUF4194 domain-containing protein [Wenzhouxiangella sp.]
MSNGISETNPDLRLSLPLIALFKGVVYADQGHDNWQNLLERQAAIADYVAQLGLELIVDEAEGYAFMRQRPGDEDADIELPRLMARRQLGYPVSLLLALLRKKLAEHDAGGGETRLVLSRAEIADLVRLFLPDSANEAKLIDRVGMDINKAVEMGFLRKLRGQDDQYEVRRILKAYVDAQWLSEIDARMGEYAAHAMED